jgi:leucyl aminopeptidase
MAAELDKVAQMHLTAMVQPGDISSFGFGITSDADTIVVGLFEDEELPANTPRELHALLDSGEARRSFKALALTHAHEKRWLLVGLGARKDFSAERARVCASVVNGRARELSTRALCWEVPMDCESEIAAAIVEGTILSDYRFDLYKSVPDGGDSGEQAPPKRLKALIVAGPQGFEEVIEETGLIAEAVNSARDLQNRSANDLTPTTLGEYAIALGNEVPALSVQVEGREQIAARGMGAFAAVAQGSEQEPALITLRYDGTDPTASPATPTLGFVGKAVTFDSGGLSLKPGAKMAEMKFDMSGGAAVLEATAAIARLELPVKLVAVIGATENLPSGTSVKPGDIVAAANGKTIEINNTDAEGRLVLADCLWHAVGEGAERIVDLATLTGAVIVALGSTYAGLMSNDDEWAGRISTAGDRSGEIVWRLPLHEEYDELIKGTYGDLDNAPEGRKAGTSSATRRGRTWTSPAPRGSSTARTSARARPATACACWSTSPGPTRASSAQPAAQPA